MLARGQGRQARHHQDARTARTRWCTAARRSSAATSGSTPITSTTATGGPTISRPLSITWSTGTTSTRCSTAATQISAGRDVANTGWAPIRGRQAATWRLALAVVIRVAAARCRRRPVAWRARRRRDHRRADVPRLRARLGRLHPRRNMATCCSSSTARASPTARALSFVNLYAYGGGFDMVAALVAKVLPFDLFETRRLVGAAVGIARPVRHLADRRAASAARSPGLIALALLATCPLYYGHMFINPKDAPFAVAMAMLAARRWCAPSRNIRRRPSRTIALRRRRPRRCRSAPASSAGSAAPCGRAALAAAGRRRPGAHGLRARRGARSASSRPRCCRPSSRLCVMALMWPWSVVVPLNPLRALVYFSHFFEKPWQELFDGAAACRCRTCRAATCRICSCSRCRRLCCCSGSSAASARLVAAAPRASPRAPRRRSCSLALARYSRSRSPS